MNKIPEEVFPTFAVVIGVGLIVTGFSEGGLNVFEMAGGGFLLGYFGEDLRVKVFGS